MQPALQVMQHHPVYAGIAIVCIVVLIVVLGEMVKPSK